MSLKTKKKEMETITVSKQITVIANNNDLF